MQTPSFVIRNLLYIIKCCKVFVNSMFVFRQQQRAENPPRRLRIFVKDAHLKFFKSFFEKTLDFPPPRRYNNTRSQRERTREYAPVAQLDRVSDYESEGRGFESLPAHQECLAQMQGILFCHKGGRRSLPGAGMGRNLPLGQTVPAGRVLCAGVPTICPAPLDNSAPDAVH